MTLSRRQHLTLTALSLNPWVWSPAHAQPREPMQASSWRPGTELAGWWVSEKFDGMRGLWDGNQLWSRSGKPIHAPAWFTQGWPQVPLDGELWAGRGRFEFTVGTVRQARALDADWRQLQYQVFDLPAHGASFAERHPALAALLQQSAVPWLQAVVQSKVFSPAELQQGLAAVLAQGGEGLMLHHETAQYEAGRSPGLRKLKLQDDAEARVVAHIPGGGQFQGQLGALLVEMPAQPPHGVRRFKLGSGLSKREREAPPPIGAVVSFRYRGLTASGLPRFATYWRLRPEE